MRSYLKDKHYIPHCKCGPCKEETHYRVWCEKYNINPETEESKTLYIEMGREMDNDLHSATDQGYFK